MSRSYAKVRPRTHYVYSVCDLMRLYGVTANTVSNWVKEGLTPSDAATPYVFSGAEVKRFHDERRIDTRQPLRKGQFICMSCRSRVFPEPRSLTRAFSKRSTVYLRGTCSTCDRPISKLVNETDCDTLLNCADTNTSLASLDEDIGLVEAGLGISGGSATPRIFSPNDRILYEWLQFAGRWDGKTVAAKLAAIREFEAFLCGKPFEKVTQADVVAFRDDLKACVESASGKRLSISTVRHRASHLKDLFVWLVEQKGYRHLGRALPSYFELPTRFGAAALSSQERPVPTLDKAVAMIEGMTARTIKERRDRAMVAIAFLGALRADTITSLRAGHLRYFEALILQDASSSRTKNGKSLRVKFFPLPAIFSETVAAWKQELLDLGFRDDDALFPEETYLTWKAGTSVRDPIPVMSSTHAVTTAFRAASRLLGERFSPHSAKHCIGQLGGKMCETAEQLKAWSMNMGHEDEGVTLRHYKTLAEDRVFEIFDDLGQSADGETLEDKELMLRFKECELDRDTPEWHRAKRLLQKRSEKTGKQ